MLSPEKTKAELIRRIEYWYRQAHYQALPNYQNALHDPKVKAIAAELERDGWVVPGSEKYGRALAWSGKASVLWKDHAHAQTIAGRIDEATGGLAGDILSFALVAPLGLVGLAASELTQEGGNVEKAALNSAKILGAGVAAVGVVATGGALLAPGGALAGVGSATGLGAAGAAASSTGAAIGGGVGGLVGAAAGKGADQLSGLLPNVKVDAGGIGKIDTSGLPQVSLPKPATSSSPAKPTSKPAPELVVTPATTPAAPALANTQQPLTFWRWVGSFIGGA